MQELTDAAKNMAMSDDLEKTANERMDLFYAFVKVFTKSLCLRLMLSLTQSNCLKSGAKAKTGAIIRPQALAFACMKMVWAKYSLGELC